VKNARILLLRVYPWGGYGALKLALRCPEKFAAAASLSGVTDLAAMWEEGQGGNEEFSRIFGSPEEFNGSDNDLFKLAKELKNSDKEIPALFQACGTEDFLYQGNVRFRDYIRQLDIPLHYQESPGVHCWDFWDANIQDVLKWLPLH
jgi:S-formylglutathione hydrolase FrmB